MSNTISFLEQYAKYTTGNECPAVYHTWCGLSALSHIIGRRVWTSQGIFVVRPNIYVILVGPPGLRKSTAKDVAMRLIRELKCAWIVPAAGTKEALLKDMAAEKSPSLQTFMNPVTQKPETFSQASVFANELLTLLQTGGDPIGYITIFTDIWDAPVFEVKTISRGSDAIEKPYVSILGCMTPEVTAAMVNERILSGGFSRRCVFVYAEANEAAVPRPFISDEQKMAWDLSKQRANEIRQLAGEFSWSVDGGEFFDNWYNHNHVRLSSPNSVAMSGFLQGKGEYVIKIAMLLCLSDSNDLVLTKDALQMSVALLDEIEPNVDRIFAGTGKNEFASTTEHIFQAVERASHNPPYCIQQKQIHKLFYKDAKSDDLDKILNHLVSVERIAGRTIEANGVRRKVFSTPEGINEMLNHYNLKELSIVPPTGT